MWQKGYTIKTKNHVVVAMCIVFLRHSVEKLASYRWLRPAPCKNQNN